MSDGKPGTFISAIGALAALAIVAVCSGPAIGGNKAAPDVVLTPAVSAFLGGGRAAIQTVTFSDSAPLNVVRGVTETAAPTPRNDKNTEVVTFGADKVKVVRGPSVAATKPEGQTETVRFADPTEAAVTVVRGPSLGLDLASIDLFGPANGGELDRIAFAVDGIESRHGADPRMWRPEASGPQGPMQVTAAAALDVGGGDRFDPRQNRLLGRAYLAQMYQRYGNWRDALAAYNWGPGNMDQWIVGGRGADRMPPGVAYYVARVLHDAVITTASRY